MRNLEKSENLARVANTEKLSLQVILQDVNDDISVKYAIGKMKAAQNMSERIPYDKVMDANSNTE